MKGELCLEHSFLKRSRCHVLKDSSLHENKYLTKVLRRDLNIWMDVKMFVYSLWIQEREH